MSRHHAPRHIELVLETTTGNVLNSDVVFAEEYDREAEIFQLREKVEEGIQRGEPTYVCTECKTPITVRARVSENRTHWYFQHLRDAPQCSIKSKHRLTRDDIYRLQYNGQKEGTRHHDLKHFIGRSLQKETGVQSVHVDRVYKELAVSKKWRKPDVLASFSDRRVAFELQISKDFLSVIVARTIFYSDRGIFLIWVFVSFGIDEEQHLFFQKDVYYNRNFNLFVLDAEAIEASKQRECLVLKCYYQKFHLEGFELCHTWHHDLVTLGELTFRNDPIEVFFYDSGAEKERLSAELAALEQEAIDREDQRRAQEKSAKMKAAEEAGVERAIQFIKDGYTHGYFPPPGYLDDPVVLLTSRQVRALNEKLGFAAKNMEWIAKLIVTGKKPSVAEYLFASESIWIDAARLKFNNEPVLRHIIHMPWSDFFRYATCLFQKGYHLTEEEHDLLESIKVENWSRVDLVQKEWIRKWGYLWLLKEWKDAERVHLMRSNAEDLLSILSLKMGVCIYHDFSNLKELTHNVLEYHKDIGDLYLKAMIVYGQDKLQYAEDRTGKIQRKIDHYYQSKSHQTPRMLRIAKVLFPELGEIDTLVGSYL